MSFYQTSKTGLIFFISLHMSSYQREFPFYLSNTFASCTNLRILTPKLCVQTQYFDFIFPMILLCFSSTCRIHHSNAVLSAIPQCTAYSDICTGYELFISLRVTHVVITSLHWARTSTHLAISLRCFFQYA